MHEPPRLNRLYQLRERLLKKGVRITDLVSGNVSTQGIVFPPHYLKAAVASGLKASKFYRPDPLGQLKAREAVSRYYAAEGVKIPPGQILLTPGTSISYWYAFKALAQPGDEILAPVPSYPLFDHIAGLANVTLKPYPLREARRWEIDFDAMEAAITPRTKAIVLVSPHNPTGAVATQDEVQRLAEIAIRHKLAIISDEVFSPFIFRASPPHVVSGGPAASKPLDPRLRGDDGRWGLPRPCNTKAPLVLTLNGFSKMLALPGMKIGWMALTGDSALVTKTIRALDMISDTFLPVNEFAQGAIPTLLQKSGGFLKSYKTEIGKRKKAAMGVFRGQSGISCIEPEGGFFITLRLVGGGVEEEELACRLLDKHHILVHPGYFYDLAGQHLVLSLVSRESVLKKAIGSLISESLACGRAS